MDTARATNRGEADEPRLKRAFVASDEREARWWSGGLAVIKGSAADTGGQMTKVKVTEPPDGFQNLVVGMSKPAGTRTRPPSSSEKPDRAQIETIAAAHGSEVLDA